MLSQPNLPKLGVGDEFGNSVIFDKIFTSNASYFVFAIMPYLAVVKGTLSLKENISKMKVFLTLHVG